MNNIEYFLQMLKDFVWEKESTILNDADWRHISKYAKLHQVEPILYKQTHRDEFKKAFAAQTYFSINRRNLINELYNALKGYEIVFVKGLEIAQHYPCPELRTMGDSDLLVHSKDRAAIHNVFMELGYSFNDYHEEEAKYLKNQFEVEVHDKLLHILEDDEQSIQFFNQVWEYVHNGKLDWNFHVIYLLKHLSRHLISGGVGFRQFMDIAIITKKVDLDWSWIEHKLDNINLLAFSKNVFELNRVWFEVEPPIQVCELESEFIEYTTNCIYEGGVFGRAASDKDIVAISNKVRRGNKPFFVAKILYLFEHLFPPYNDMVKNEFCSYLLNKKYFLPIAWIQRLIIYSKSAKKKDALKRNLLSSDREINQRNIFLSKFGL